MKRNGKRSNKSPTSRDPSNFASQNGSRVAVADFTRELKSVDSRSIQLVQTVDLGPVSSTSAAAGAYAFALQFNELPDAINYATTWDMYRIDSLEYHFIPTSQPALPSSALAYSFLYVVNDYDDSVVPTGTSQMMQYPNLTICGPGQSHTRKIRPHQAIPTTNSSGISITGVRNELSGWNDITSQNINHYGVKVLVQQSTSTNLNAWYVFCRVGFSLRSQR